MSSGGGMDDVDQSSSKKPVSFQFCAECSNMLYPREDNSSRTLQFVCRTCHYTTEAINTCVFRNELSSTASLHAGIIPGMGKDPTVGAALAAPVNESADGSASASVAVNAVVAAPSFPLTHSRPPSPPASDYSGSSPATTVLLCTSCGLPVLCEVCGIAHIYIPITQSEETHPGTAPASPGPSPPSGPSAGNAALDFSDISLYDDDMMYDFMGEGVEDAEDADDEAQQAARD